MTTNVSIITYLLNYLFKKTNTKPSTNNNKKLELWLRPPLKKNGSFLNHNLKVTKYCREDQNRGPVIGIKCLLWGINTSTPTMFTAAMHKDSITSDLEEDS